MKTVLSELLELRSLRRNWRLPPEQLRWLQLRRLQSLVRHAAANVPFYRELFRSHGVQPDDIRTLDDITRLPVVTKTELRDAADSTVADGADLSRCIVSRTSGSTGIPFRVLRSKEEHQTRRLVHFRNLQTAGFTWRDRIASLGPGGSRKTRPYERLGLFRTEAISGAVPVDEQIERLKAFQPTILWTYPHPLQELLYRLEGKLSRIVRPHTLIVSGAMLAPQIWEDVRADLQCRTLQLYGCIETGRLATGCPSQDGMHVNADQVIIELLDDGRPVTPGERGVTVVTALNYRTMPFIRYNLGDYCTLRDIPQRCSCGSHFPVASAPEGRADDVFRLPSGRVIGSIPFLFAIRRVTGIDQYRFIQVEPARFILEIATRTPWPEDKVNDLRTEMLNAIPEPVEFDIRLLDFLPSGGAKLRSFVCQVSDS